MLQGKGVTVGEEKNNVCSECSTSPGNDDNIGGFLQANVTEAAESPVPHPGPPSQLLEKQMAHAQSYLKASRRQLFQAAGCMHRA